MRTIAKARDEQGGYTVVIAWGMTDVGSVRTINQDTFIVNILNDGTQGIFIVCDGMGGANAGEIASEIAANTMQSELKGVLKPNMSLSYMKNAIKDAIVVANRAVLEKSKQDSALFGMGTTAVCLMIDGDNAVFGNVGDSRAYIAIENKISQITEDHSLVNDMVKRNEITPEEAVKHPKKNVITKALGVEPTINCDVFPLKLTQDVKILLCSDGLTNEVSDPELCYELMQAEAVKDICQSLISIANKRGGHDNITAVIIAQ